MPSLFVASMIVLLSGTSTGRPSISSFAMCVWSVLSVNEALAVVDVVLELVAKMLDEAFHRQRGGIAQRADRAAGDVVRHRIKFVEIFRTALPVLDAMDHAIQPAGAFAARRALAAGFFEIKIRQPLQRTYHARGFVH